MLIDEKELFDNSKVVSLVFIFMTLFSIILERFLHILEKKLERHKHLLVILHAIYKELMVLGFISLILEVLEMSHLIEFKVKDGESSSSIFTFVHLFIFVSSIYFILTVLTILVPMKIDWKWMRNLENEANRKEIVKQFEESLAYRQHAGFMKYFNFIELYKFFSVLRKVQFLHIRNRFIQNVFRLEQDGIMLSYVSQMEYVRSFTTESLKLGAIVHMESERNTRNNLIKTFDFAKYIRRCTRESTISILHIDWQVWSIILVICVANIIRVNLKWDTDIDYRETYIIFILLGFLWTFLLFIIYVNIWKGLQKYIGLVRDVVDCENVAGITATTKRTYESLSVSQQSFLLFQKPVTLTFYVIKLLIMFQSFYVALLIIIYADELQDHSFSVVLLALLPPLLNLLLLPLIMPILTLLTNIEEETNYNSVIEVLDYMTQEAANERKIGKKQMPNMSGANRLLNYLLNIKRKRELKKLQKQQQSNSAEYILMEAEEDSEFV